MNILATQFDIGRSSLEIFLAGCKGNPKCTNCHNPESWYFNSGDVIDAKFYKKLQDKDRVYDSLIKSISIMGGEPLDQNVVEFCDFLKELTKIGKEIWLFTRYELDEIPEYVKVHCDYIKCGRYLEEFKATDNIQYGVCLATTNQNIYKRGVNY